MAGSKSNWLENHFLDALYGGGTFTEPSTVYLALYASDPTDADTGIELNGGGYARVALTPGTDLTVTGNAMTNANEISFPESTGDQNGPATHFGLRDASTGGNLLHHGSLSVSRAVDSAGITIKVPAGELDVTED